LSSIGLVVIVSTALVAGCTPAGSPAPTATAQSPTAAPSGGGVATPAGSVAPADLVIPKPEGDLAFKFGFVELDPTELPTRITIERLNADGWNIEMTELAAADLSAQALDQGTIQMNSSSIVDPLRAVQAGADISWAFESHQGEYVFITRAEFADCQALDGKTFGMHGETSSSSLAGRTWLEDECGVTPEILIIPGGDNRVVALINGQLDSTVTQLFDWLTLKEQAPNDFHVLDTGDLFTAISGTAFYVNSEFATQREAVAVAFIAEQLKTYRMIREDPSILADKIRSDLPEYPAELADITVTEYLDTIGAFPANGGDTDMVENAIAYFTEIEELQPGLTVDQVANRTLLDKALQIIGTVTGER
jgi:ABC-type nitrate/sulfonate/bicarbonate transport system substrate-binding protein